METNPRFARQIIYGPVKSRRLGNSLGINLMPGSAKVCSFDCIYCECGLNDNKIGQMPKQDDIKLALKKALEVLKEEKKPLDSITFSGNGEPTLHPDFEAIINSAIALRNQNFPQAKISVLSNSTLIDKPDIFRALSKVDNNILKLDSAIEDTMRIIDQPNRASFTVKWMLKHLKEFEGNLIIQTIFISGEYKGKHFDNTTEEEITALISAYKEIKPKSIMIYALDRPAPVEKLDKIPLSKLKEIAERLEAEGFEVIVSA